MAASEAEKYASSDKEIVDSKLTLSAYANSLESSIKKRYVEKISVIGMDPLLVPLQKYTPECRPPVEACAILSYLVLETSFYTRISEAFLPTIKWFLVLLQVFLAK